MPKKGRRKDESKGKKEAASIIVDPNLEKIVLRNLSLTSLHEIIEFKEENPDDEQG
jgi:hypothetical protein